MPPAVAQSPLLRALFRFVWIVAIAFAPFAMPGISGQPGGPNWPQWLFGGLTALFLFLSTPWMAIGFLVGVEWYHLFGGPGQAPLISLYSVLALACLGLAAFDKLRASYRFDARLRPFMLPFACIAALPLYFAWCSPWPSIVLVPWALLLWASMPRSRPLAVELAGAAAGASAAVLLFMLVAELGARLSYPPNPPNHLLQAHPTRIVNLVPNAKGAFSFDQFQSPPFRVSISSQGLRDVEYGPKLPGTLRVLALGDSTTFGWGVALEESLPRQIETLLRKKTGIEKIEVLNAGTPTYAPWQCLDWLRQRAGEFQPDMVLYSLFPVNDAGDELYRVGKQLKCHTPEAIAAMRRFERALLWPERLDAWLHRHSRAYQLAIGARLSPEHPLLLLTSQMRSMQGELFPPLPPPEMGLPAMELNRSVWYPELEEAVALSMESMEQMRQHCAEQGWPFAVLVLASSVVVEQAGYESAAAKCPFEVAPFMQARETGVFTEALGKAGISNASTRELMLMSPEPSTLHLPLDGHLSARGNRIAAQVAVDLLMDIWPG